MFQFQLLPSLGDLSHMLFIEEKFLLFKWHGKEWNWKWSGLSDPGSTFRTCSRFSSLARSLWFSSRTELCWAVTSERSSLSSSFSARVWGNNTDTEKQVNRWDWFKGKEWVYSNCQTICVAQLSLVGKLSTWQGDTDLVEQLCLPPEEICLLL